MPSSWRAPGLVAVLSVLGACAGPAASTGTVASASASRQTEDAVARLRQDVAAQQRRADELEARVALLESEASNLRVSRAGKITETIVVGGRQAEQYEDGSYEEEESPAEERPLTLRLVGTPRAASTRIQDEPLPLVTEKLPIVPLPAAEQSTARPAPLPNLKQRYASALRLLRERKYASAKEAFLALSRDVADQAIEDRVIYWLGESAYALRQYGEATTYFERLIKVFPNSDKVPDALLKTGLSHKHLGASSSAERYMARVRRDYPDSQAARLASAEGL